MPRDQRSKSWKCDLIEVGVGIKFLSHKKKAKINESHALKNDAEVQPLLYE